MPRRKTVPADAPPAPVEAVAPVPVPPQTPSPAVLALQSQVVELVSQRSQSRQRLTDAHADYLSAQARFQAAQQEMKGVESEVQYRIGLIAQLENRAPQYEMSVGASNVFPMPSLNGVSSEPTVQQVRRQAETQYGRDDMINRGDASALRSQI